MASPLSVLTSKDHELDHFRGNMKLVFFLFSLAMAGISTGVMARDSAVCSSLGLPIPFVFDVLPLAAAAVCFFILAFRLNKEEDLELWRFIRTKQIIERLILVGGMAFAVLSGVNFFCGKRAAESCFTPVLAVAVAGFGLGIRPNKAELKSVLQSARRNRLIERFLLAALVLAFAWTIAYVCFQTKVAKVSVEALEETDRQQLQTAIPFKVITVSDSAGVTICFARAAGRTEEVRSALSKLRSANPRKQGR